MVRARKTLKILHTLATAGIVGGLAAYMILLVTAPQDTPQAYADLRASIAALSNYLLLPSLAVVLVSGLFAMVVHSPYLDKGWVWLKAGSGILMFKGVLTIIGAKADYAASVSARIAEGEEAAAVLERALAYEWTTLWIMLALSVANVVLGVWRPKLSRDAKAERSSKRDAKPEGGPRSVVAEHGSAQGASQTETPERTRPAA
jgi:hypothetical protein